LQGGNPEKLLLRNGTTSDQLRSPKWTLFSMMEKIESFIVECVSWRREGRLGRGRRRLDLAGALGRCLPCPLSGGQLGGK